jgi:hypothetical protein
VKKYDLNEVLFVIQPWKYSSSNSQLASLNQMKVITIVSEWIKFPAEASTADHTGLASRMMQAASTFSILGYWRPATELMIISRSLSSIQQCNSIDVEIRIGTSNFIIDRLYANTYVSRSLEDTVSLQLACELARSAVTDSSEETTDGDGGGDDGGDHYSIGEALQCKYPNRLIRRGAAYMALGRSCGLYGQYLALGGSWGWRCGYRFPRYLLRGKDSLQESYRNFFRKFRSFS